MVGLEDMRYAVLPEGASCFVDIVDSHSLRISYKLFAKDVVQSHANRRNDPLFMEKIFFIFPMLRQPMRMCDRTWTEVPPPGTPRYRLAVLQRPVGAVRSAGIG